MVFFTVQIYELKIQKEKQKAITFHKSVQRNEQKKMAINKNGQSILYQMW